MAIIEGLGDEVVWAALALLLIVVIFLAWISTYVHAHNAINVGSGSVWLVQLHNWSNRPVQVGHYVFKKVPTTLE